VKLTAGVEVLCPVALVEGHIEPFHGEACAGLLKVALRQKLCNAQHLFPSIEMVEGLCHEHLSDVVVATRRQIDI
jgi:hypothetical protein